MTAEDKAMAFVRALRDDVYRYTWGWVIAFGVPESSEDHLRCLAYVQACLSGADRSQLVQAELLRRRRMGAQ